MSFGFPFTSPIAATISKDECVLLNELLGNKAPSGCDISMSHNGSEGKHLRANFAATFGSQSAHHAFFKHPITIPGGDNLTGMPRGTIPGGDNLTGVPSGTRRMTNKNSLHVSKRVSKRREEVTVNEDECNNLAAILSEKVGEKEARASLPKACQKMM
jgi:hypothetical protein